MMTGVKIVKYSVIYLFADELKNTVGERGIHRDVVISSEKTIQKAQKFLHAE